MLYDRVFDITHVIMCLLLSYIGLSLSNCFGEILVLWQDALTILRVLSLYRAFPEGILLGATQPVSTISVGKTLQT